MSPPKKKKVHGDDLRRGRGEGRPCVGSASLTSHHLPDSIISVKEYLGVAMVVVWERGGGAVAALGLIPPRAAAALSPHLLALHSR